MKFLIVAFHPRSMTPYAQQYEDIIVKYGYDYDILFWDRFSNGPLEKNGNQFIFHRICTLGGSKLKKIYPFYLFRKTLKEIIKNENYNKIIILNTMPGFLLHDILLSKYSNNYILDIRDYTYEKYGFYLRIIHKLINNSSFTAISSRGFKKFLGESDKLVVNHNISNLEDACDKPTLYEHKKPITIGFVGAVRYFDENVALIKSMQNFRNIRLSYVGRQLTDCHLDAYCKRNKYNHIKFLGEFKNQDKSRIYEDIDIINSLYGNKSMEVCAALPNRLYDALIFKKPILTTKGTYLSEVVLKYGIGLALSDSQTYTPQEYQKSISEYIGYFNSQKFIKNTNDLLKKVKKEQRFFHQRIAEFVIK